MWVTRREYNEMKNKKLTIFFIYNLPIILYDKNCIIRTLRNKIETIKKSDYTYLIKKMI